MSHAALWLQVLHTYPASAPHPIRGILKKHPALLAMCEGLRDRAYPDGTSPHFVEKLRK